jgi:curved DNA-binding protein CbpA
MPKLIVLAGKVLALRMSFVENYFQILNQPRRPLLNDGELMKSYLAAIEKNHPDRATAENRKQAEEQTSLINRAYRVLKFPLERFRHLIEVADLDGSFDSGLSESYGSLFEKLYALSQESEKFVEEFQLADAEIEKTFLRHTQLRLVADLKNAQRQINALEQGLYATVAKIDQEWDEDRKWEELAEVTNNLAFCQKWQNQLDLLKNDVLSRV